MFKAHSKQIEALETFGYVKTLVVNHTDESFLPVDRRDQRDLNLVVRRRDDSVPEFVGGDEKNQTYLSRNYAMATHVIPTPPPPNAPAYRKKILQTTNPIYPPHPLSIISVARIERALLSVESKIAQRGLITAGKGSWRVVRGLKGKGGWRLEFVRKRKIGALQGPGRARPEARISYADEATNVASRRTGTPMSPPPGIWLCGSYASPGIPLLEACVTSALTVVEEGVYVSEGVEVSGPSSRRAAWAV